MVVGKRECQKLFFVQERAPVLTIRWEKLEVLVGKSNGSRAISFWTL